MPEGTSEKPKNILMIHLESISNTILWQYRVELGTLWRLLQKSLWYTNFQTSANSTEMSMTDILHGDSCTGDGKAHFRDPARFFAGWPLAILHSKGYQLQVLTRNFMYARPRETGYFYDTPSLDDFFRKQTEFMQSCRDAGAPFFLYVNNAISHMAFDAETKARAGTFSERFKNGYMDFDASVKFTLTRLAELGLWDNTLIVCFGDHGDELWSHGVGKGYCHVITPYASQCRTPLFIHDSAAPEGICHDLVSSEDLLPGLFNLAMPGHGTRHNSTDNKSIITGNEMRTINHFQTLGASSGFPAVSRFFAFSQNLHALQLEYDDPEKGLTKGYAVTNLRYRLTVSSGGNNPYGGGLEMFVDYLDPANMLNLLNFFELDRNGDIVGVRRPKGPHHPDLEALFHQDTLDDIRWHYKLLKGELQAYVRGKELRAMAFNSGEKHLMPESAFRRVKENIRMD